MPTQELLSLIGVLILCGVWLYSCIRNTRKAWKGLGFKYSMKVFTLYLQMPIFFILAIYWVLITVSVMPPFILHIYSSISPESFLGITLPMAYAVLVVLVMVLLMPLSHKPFWKLTDDENEYQEMERKEKKALFNEKLETYPKIIRWILTH